MIGTKSSDIVHFQALRTGLIVTSARSISLNICKLQPSNCGVVYFILFAYRIQNKVLSDIKIMLSGSHDDNSLNTVPFLTT